MSQNIFQRADLATLLNQLPKGWALRKKKHPYYDIWQVLDARGRIFHKGSSWEDAPKVLTTSLIRLVRQGAEALSQ